MSNIKSHVDVDGLDLARIFDIFERNGGFIMLADLIKILDLIGFPHNDRHMELIK